jgi:SAM-dependent methyltransferase
MPELVRIARAIATNQVARFMPGAYVRLTGQTGRGDSSQETAQDIAAYFLRCVEDYLDFGRVPPDQRGSFFSGLCIVEYGPGDFPGVAIVMLARGARRVWCVDRFPMVRLSPKNLAVLQALLSLLEAPERARVETSLRDPARPEEGFRPEVLGYEVRPHGFSGLHETADLTLSRAVLEHVDDLPGTFADMLQALRPGGIAWHLVDLKSHGLHRRNPLDFLCWSPGLWSAMYSHKGVPNRWRIDRYRTILEALNLQSLRLEPTLRATPEQVADVRSALAEPFRGLSDADLACLGCWIGFRKPGGLPLTH